MSFDIVSNPRRSGKSHYAVKKLREVWERGKTSLMMCAGYMKFEDYTVKYDYKCKECGKVFEVESLMRDLGYTEFPCPKCKSPKTHRIITSAPQVQFKGPGFYSSDNKKG
jgi:putative FmdB family regulatory protein